MTGNNDWSWLAQQTQNNSPLVKSQQFLQAAQGAGQAINSAGNVLQQGIKKKLYRQAGNEILGLMEQGNLNEQTMAGVLKNNRLGMQDAQEIIGLMQKSGALEEMKARTAGIKANTQATIGQEQRSGQKFGQETDEFNWQKSNRDADRALSQREAESRINANNANADYSRSGKAAGNKSVDPADKVKDFIANHPQIKALMTPDKEGKINHVGKDERDYYEELAASEGFKIKFREEPETYGNWARLPGGHSVGDIKVDEKTGKPKGAGNYFIESIVYVGNQPTANQSGSGNTDPLGLGL